MGNLDDLDLIAVLDTWIDQNSSPAYQNQPLAKTWGRIAKVSEECGEVIAAFIGATGQNPRKGFYCDMDDVLAELADVVITAACAMQHITKDRNHTGALISDRIAFLYHRANLDGDYHAPTQPKSR